jgi:hypothetical protein
MPPEIRQFRDKVVEQGRQLRSPIQFAFYENRNRHQRGNTECGMYALYFLIQLLKDNSAKNVEFFRDGHLPDKQVEAFRRIYFNLPSKTSGR